MEVTKYKHKNERKIHKQGRKKNDSFLNPNRCVTFLKNSVPVGGALKQIDKKRIFAPTVHLLHVRKYTKSPTYHAF
jgi:hypothetical protein